MKGVSTSDRFVMLGSGGHYGPGNFGLGTGAEVFEQMFDPEVKGIADLPNTVNPKLIVERLITELEAAGAPIGALRQWLDEMRDSKYEIARAGLIPPFDLPPGKYPREITGNAGKAISMAIEAADAAVTDSGLPRCSMISGANDGLAIDSAKLGISPYRIMVAGAAGWGGSVDYNEFFWHYITGQWRKIGARAIQAAMPSGQTVIVASLLRAMGPTYTLSNACASGYVALDIALMKLKSGAVDVVIVPGTETIDGFFMALFRLGRALSPTGSSIPFGGGDGFVIGEASSCVVVVRLSKVLEWGLENHIVGEFVGVGGTNDADGDMVAPNFEAGYEAASQACEMAEKIYGFDRKLIRAVFAHGTSTPKGDPNEIAILLKLLKQKLYVMSCKAAFGHSLASSALQTALIAMQAMVQGRIPSMGNFSIADDCAHTNLEFAVDAPINNADIPGFISNSLAFGGDNRTIVCRRYEG